MENKQKICNLQESPRSTRDLQLCNLLTSPKTLPKKVSLKKYCDKVLNQGDAGLCHSYAGAYFKGIQETMETSRKMDMSPIALAKEVKKIDSFKGQEGSDILSVFKAIYNHGTVKDSDYPYSYEAGSLQFKELENDDKVPHYKIANYARCNNVEDIKYALSLNKPVVVGIIAFENFYDIWESEFCPMPKGKSIGGHAMVAIGYDDDLEHEYPDGTKCKGFLHLLNSWGEDCGDGGYIYIPYDYLNKKTNDMFQISYLVDAYTGVDLENDPIDQDVIEMWIGEKEMKVNGTTVVLDQAPEINPDTSRALIPVRWVEALGYEVYWNDAQKKITIIKNKEV